MSVGSERIGQRIIDLIVSVTMLVLLLPVLAAIGLAVAVANGRPVLFRQRRTGLSGREFTIVKFRTMRAERYAGEPDPDRLTAVGRILRGTSLDELPQLLNLLNGDMSLIGPRPTLPEQVVHYSPRQRGRLAIRPGLTGWAQVNGRNSIDWPTRIEMDLWYIQHRSLRLDLRILWLTALRLLHPSGVTADGGINPGFPVSELAAQSSLPQARSHND